LIQQFQNNLLSFLALALAITIGTCLTWSVFGGLVSRPLPEFPKIFTEGIPEADMRRAVEKLLPYVNKSLHFIHRVLSGKDILMSVWLGAVLYLAHRVLETVSLLAVAYSFVVIVFTMPKVYEMYHDQIDEAVNMFRQKATFVYDAYLAKLLKKIPSAGNQATPAESSTTAVGERTKDD
jgi:hypothetical protein